MTTDFPDEFDEYLAEQMQDPSFAEAYRQAEARVWLEEQALDGARWLAKFWFVAGLLIGVCAVYLYQSPWAAMAFAPWAACQAVERLFAWQFGRR